MTPIQDVTSRYSRNPDAPEYAHPLSRAAYAMGSILSVGLVIGLGVWGYKLLVRDVSGVPVIRAAEGPMRVQPENPGGVRAMNQGLAVNDVAAIGAATTAPDQLILAPAPLKLSDEDAAGEGSNPTVEAVERTIAARAEAKPENLPKPAEPANAETDSAVDGEPDMQALAEAISAGITPLEDLTDESDVTPVETPEEVAAPGAVAISLRPRARPTDLRNIREVAAIAPEATGPRDVDPDTIPVGTRLAQLGAFSSEEIARKEWDRIDARFDEYMVGKDRVIQRATSGGRTFYRLRVLGFDDLADARRFCSALVSEKAECIPVVTR